MTTVDPDQDRMVDIALPLDVSEDETAWRRAAARELNVSPRLIGEMRLRKHSIDARQRRVRVQLRLEVALGEGATLMPDEPIAWKGGVGHTEAFTAIIVGAGPAGLFAALKCLELGGKPIVLERGKDASARRYDLAPILRHGRVVEDSNYCFGEGGAGTFSDGKLYTRAKKRGPVSDVYRTLVANGAPERILIDAHPHIGSNLLPNVVKSIRKSIIEAGGEVHFGARVEQLLRNGNRLCGVGVADGREFIGDAVILATGHSARDIYELLHRENVLLEQKPFAMGMRIEHSQPLIDRLQYSLEGDERPRLLPAASYSLATKIEGRGVHSFCMCPGGFIVPSSTENDEVVVNGMSLAKRDSPFANSGMVVTVEPADTAAYQKEYGVLAGMRMQRELELAARVAGGNNGETGQVAPAQRVTDFLNGRDSAHLAPTSYKPGLNPARLDEILPGWMVGRLKRGMSLFGRKMRGYVTREANFIGFETRTSSPVRIPRDRETLEHPELAGLFPCGEGAGFAGGIVSAALDGMRSAEAVAASIKK